MSNIGIGVITTGNRKLRDYKTSNPVVVYTDKDRKGSASARNMLLKKFWDEGKDYIFLFDDDTYPVMGGWENYFIEQAKTMDLNFIGLPEIFKDQPLEMRGEMVHWKGVLTPFAFYTRKVIEVVGYQSTKYEKYGFEDAGYYGRIKRSGKLVPWDEGWWSPIRASAYIHSEDVFGENPNPNMSHADKMKYIEMNKYLYQEEISAIDVYVPFSTK